MKLFIILAMIIAGVWGYWLWFIEWPRAWKDGSNKEINDIKTYYRYLKRKR